MGIHNLEISERRERDKKKNTKENNVTEIACRNSCHILHFQHLYQRFVMIQNDFIKKKKEKRNHFLNKTSKNVS